MKILILTETFPPYAPGGAGRSAFDLARAFQKKGHEVFVITTCQENTLCGKSDLKGLKVFRIYSKYHSRWRGYLSLYNYKTVRKVEVIMREIKPDIVSAQNIHYYLSYFCFKLAKKYSKGVFFTARDVMSFNYGKLVTEKYLKRFEYHTNWWDHIKQARKRYNPFRNIIIRHYLSSVDKVFAISKALKQALNENRIQNVEVIYNGIRFEEWKISPDLVAEFKEKYNIQNKKVILVGGRLSALKGREKILQAMKRVVEQVPEAVLLVAGKRNSYIQGMSETAQKLGIESHIFFTGWLKRDQMKLAHLCSDLVVVPSVCFDSFNLFNIEAMAAKKPVVGTCFGGTPEIVQDGITGFIVNPFDVELMADKIIHLLKNPQKAKQFGEAGFARVKQAFNLEKQADKYLNWFNAKLGSAEREMK